MLSLGREATPCIVNRSCSVPENLKYNVVMVFRDRGECKGLCLVVLWVTLPSFDWATSDVDFDLLSQLRHDVSYITLSCPKPPPVLDIL